MNPQNYELFTFEEYYFSPEVQFTTCKFIIRCIVMIEKC